MRFLVALIPAITFLAPSVAFGHAPGHTIKQVGQPTPRLVLALDAGTINISASSASRVAVGLGLRFADRLVLGVEYARLRWDDSSDEREQYAGARTSYSFDRGQVRPFVFLAAGGIRTSDQFGDRDFVGGRGGGGLSVVLGSRLRLNVSGHIGRRKIVSEDTRLYPALALSVYRPEREGRYHGAQIGLSLDL